MGDCSAARGSEIILRISELNIFAKLSNRNLLKNVSKYIRFRDDVSIHIIGSHPNFLSCVKIICSGYPTDLMFNVESRLICGKFLNIRVYIPSNGLEPFTTVLRKENNKYNITPPTSNVSQKYKNMAGLGYFRTARMLCSSPEELRNQYRTIQHILRLKGFSKQLKNEIQSTKIISDKKSLKRFISTVIFD